jgi:hypothetical protein
VATVAQVGGLHPMQVMEPLTIFFRFQMAVVVGLLVFALLPEPKQWKWAVAILLLDAALPVEVLFFGNTFFSSNCTAPLFAIYLVWLALQQEFHLRESVVVLLMNLFFLLTYPEFLVLAKFFEGVAVLVAWRRGNRRMWQPLMACNLAVLALHPLLVWAKVALLTQHMPVNFGCDLLGNPRREPLHYIANLVGMRCGSFTIEVPPLINGLAWAVVPLVLSLVVVGIVQLGRRYRATIPLAAWAGLFVALNVRSAVTGTYFYGAAKLLAHTYFVVMLGCAALVAAAQAPRRHLVIGVLLLWLAVVATFTVHLVSQFHDEICTVDYSALRAALRTQADGQPVAVLCHCREPLMLTNMIAGESNVITVALTKQQLMELTLFGLGRYQDCTLARTDAPCYDGLALCDAEVLRSGEVTLDTAVFRVECSRVLCRLGDFVLCQTRVHAEGQAAVSQTPQTAP